MPPRARRRSGRFGPWPCPPSLPSFGQGLQLTIHSRDADAARVPEGPVNSLRDLFVVLRACWEPPPLEEAFHGMQMSVRFSFKRTGEAVAAPRVTYASSEAAAAVRSIYRRAVDAALERCTPMPFSRKWAARSPAAQSRFASLMIAILDTSAPPFRYCPRHCRISAPTMLE